MVNINRNVGIDLLRAICITYIVAFWHLLNHTNAISRYNNIVTYGMTWVILATFMFISGCFIGNKRVIINKENLITFYISRFLRIYPLYLFALIIFTMLGLTNLWTTVKAALLISVLIGPPPPTLWFVIVLLIFYVFSPFLLETPKVISVLKLITLYVIINMLLLSYWYFTRLLDIRMIVYFPSFVFGLSASRFRHKILEGKYYIYLLLAMILSLVTDGPNNSLNMLFATPMVTLASFLLFSLFKNCSFERQNINNKILIVSYSSYCMYLFHRPIYLVTFGLCTIGILSYSMQRIYDNGINLIMHNTVAKLR